MSFGGRLKLHARARFAVEARTSIEQAHGLQVHGGLVNTRSLMNVPLGPDHGDFSAGLEMYVHRWHNQFTVC
jgi:hypothetical protein